MLLHLESICPLEHLDHMDHMYHMYHMDHLDHLDHIDHLDHMCLYSLGDMQGSLGSKWFMGVKVDPVPTNIRNLKKQKHNICLFKRWQNISSL